MHIQKTSAASVLPGADLSFDKMPGHWVMAQMGKRVLRPGGLELTRTMLDALAIQPSDRVVELAPGLGVTARLALSRRPASYMGVERDAAAATQVRTLLTGPTQQCQIGRAEETGLPDGSATVIYGEAMLTMHSAGKKSQIVQEAARVLQPGGRYGIHEMCLQPESLPESLRDEISRALSERIRVGARPLTVGEWRAVLENEGFTVTEVQSAPMHLLEGRRFVQDEGIAGTLHFLWNLARHPRARQRVLAMRELFREYAPYLEAVMIVGRKEGSALPA